MKRSFLLSVVLLFSFAAVAQDPVIRSLEPNAGPESGGTRVTITGDHLLPSIQCVIPCPAKVTFDKTTVEVEFESENRLVVVAPPHAPGVVDVVVEVSGRQPVPVWRGFTYIADGEAVYEQVLLPIYVNGVAPGANGSQWSTDFWIRNNSPKEITLAPWPCTPAGAVCPPVFPWTETLAPERSIHNLPPAYKEDNGNPSRVLYVRHETPSDVAFSLRFADASRSALNSGTDLPVVRESEFLTQRANLLNVPVANPFRVMLRVYELGAGDQPYAVTFYPQSEGIVNPLLAVNVTPVTNQTGEFRTEAGYAQLDVTQLIAAHPGIQWPENVRIEIRPLSAASRFWTFASVTNNGTQLVTLVTPQ